MNARERVLTAAFGGRPDRVPVTVYEGLVPRGRAERQLREQGLCLMSGARPYRIRCEGLRRETRRFERDGQTWHRELLSTPAGRLTSLGRTEPGYESRYRKQHFVKDPADYEVLEWIWRNTRFEPHYAPLQRRIQEVGGDGVATAHMGKTPFQELLISCTGPERLSIDRRSGRGG